MILSSAIALATILASAVALAMVLPSAMSMVDDGEDYGDGDD